ncbi:MAG TPA: sulfur carrier protein ThiS [Polyangiaceae bacterium]|nr:sulfur carrier protein ThiS [Polyangiaceae bacterium]
MPLTVNGDPHPWREGLTVQALLVEKNYTFPLRVIFVNKQLVKKENIPTTVLHDGDQVEVVHLIGGG